MSRRATSTAGFLPTFIVIALATCLAFLSAGNIAHGHDFIRGDINGNRKVTITDAAQLFAWLAGGLAYEPTCLDSADVNDDGAINIVDGVFILYHAFSIPGSTPIPAPFPDCGTDPTESDLLDCQDHGWCP